jgi:hypothetical protein
MRIVLIEPWLTDAAIEIERHAEGKHQRGAGSRRPRLTATTV